MSASGEGEQISDISKDDDESEVTSTTRDNSGRKPSLCPTSTDSTFPIINTDSAIPIAADTAPGALQHVNEDVPLVIPPTDFVDDGKALDELDIDPNVASTTAMPMEDEVSKPVIQTTVDSDQNTQTSAPEDVPNSEDNIATEESVIDKDFNLGIEPKSSVIKEINEIIQADADKDSSSLGEELELRWEDDDDDENDETLQTADVLKQLDQELEDIGGSDVSQEANKETEIVAIKPESLVENIDENIKESTKNPEPIEDSSKTLHDKSSDVDNANLDVQMLSCNDASEIENNIDENSKIKDNNDMEIKGETSFEESQPIIDQIDSLTKSAEDIEMEKAMDIPVTKIIEPQTDQIDSLTKEDLDQDIEMENLIESEKPVKVAEITSVSSPKDFEEMDVDTSSVNVITVPTIAENTLVPIESTKQLNLNRIQNVNSEVLDNKDTQRATMEVSKNAAVLEKPDQNDGSTNISDVSSVILPLEAVNDDESHKIITSSGVSSVTLPVEVLNTDESEKIITTSNVPTTLPLEVLNISDKAEPESDCETKEAPSQPPTCEQLSKDTKNKLDDIQDVDINASQLENDSLLETTITPNVHHRINKPNVMLDIPTQELSDIEAELDNDDSENEDNNGDKTHEGIKIDVVKNSPKLDASLTDDIDMKDSNNTKIVTESCDTSTPAPIIKVIISPTIEIDATSSKLNITTVSPAKSETSKSIQLPSLSKKLQFDDIKPTTSQPEQDIDVDAPSSSKVEHETDDTSESVEIDCEKPSSSKPVQNNDDEKPSTSKINQETDDEKPSTSKIVQETDDEKPSTSKIVPETDDGKPTSKITQETDDEKPSTSKPDVTSGKLTPDNIDSVQEVTDSLGLLAESSRVMDDDNDDDDDADDPEADDNDNDDDEDFDPYEETNSEIADDMDDSNTPPPELDPKMDQPESSKVLEERESDEGTMDITEGTMDIVDDIECVENELPEMELPDDAVSETPSNEDNARKEDESDIIDADTLKDKSTTKCPPEKIINILEKVLGQTGAKSKDSSSVVGNIRSYVELEGSSDSDDVLEVSKSDVMSVNIPKDVEVMSTSGPHGSSEIVSRKGEVVINWVAKPPPPQKMSKINTSEVTIKTTGTPSPSIHIPETTSVKPKAPKEEIFSLDSDEEDTEKKKRSPKDDKKGTKEEPSKSAESKCINPDCTSENQTYYQADRATAAYYSLTRRSAVVCEQCRQRASERSEALLNGIKDLRPLLELDMTAPSQQLVEISDSDSDGEGGDDTPLVGERGAVYLEEHLADMINQTWAKYKMDSRLKDTETYLMAELDKIQAGAKEIDAMLDECQKKTDSIRLDFYKDYELRRKSLGAIIIHDTPFSSFCCNEEKQSGYSHTEKDVEETAPQTFGSRYPKRRAASIADTPAKRPAIPMGYLPLDADKMGTQTDGPTDQNKDDDKEDISVVKLSAESAPADLPPCGEIVRPPLKNGMIIYAMRNAFGTWLKGKIMDVIPKAAGQQFTQCRVKFEHKVKNPCKVLAARCLAYPDPCEVRMTIGTRVVALFKDPHNTTRRDSFYSGVIAEIPNPVNNYRYLVFFDDGYAQYVHHQDTRIVCESSNLVWEEVHPFIRDFICNYLLSYPERPMVRLHAGEKLKTEWNGKWWDSKVLQVDASIALINFDEDNRTEWIYRGSTRLAPLYLELQAAEKAGEGRTRSRLPRSKAQMRSNMPCVEYTRSDEQAAAKATAETQAQQQHNEEMRRQRSVAKKSTTTPAQPPTFIQGTPFEGVISRVVYYTPKNAVKPYKMSPHTCTAKCRRSDLLSLKDLRTYNPLAKPLLSGWERQTVRYKGHRAVAYRAPCGRRVRGLGELHRYLRTLHCDLPVDLFDFTPGTHCLAEFVLHKCIVSKKDLSHGKENVPVPCVNYYDDSLPEFCSYNTERTPTAGVPLNLDPEFLCGCDCTDDCMDKSKCDCWKMTLEGARTIGLDGPNVGYVYRRLPEPLPSGIYECNSRCKCKQTCLNRVAQHPLQLKLQVFKTINRGWGIRALNDVPKGSFLCVYAGNLLTDATANLDGLNEGDEYLAELDYIEVVEAMKEGYEDDVPDADKQLDKKRSESDSESEPSSESEDERDKTEKDGDFQPGYIPHSNVEFRKSLRKRQKAKKKEELEKQKEAAKKRNDCITISDDEEVREPSRFTAQAGMVDKDLISKHSSRVSVRTLFGKDEACYIMDAKVQGNIGRYLNHSCHPNVFVQNVFVDTHDPRFPWVAFFALAHVRAGTELTWNYNYDIGSVPEKVLYCYCGAPNCRGRLL